MFLIYGNMQIKQIHIAMLIQKRMDDVTGGVLQQQIVYDGKQIPEDLCAHLDEEDRISSDTEVGSSVSSDDDSDLLEIDEQALLPDLNCKERCRVIIIMFCQYIIRQTLSVYIPVIYSVIKE